MPRTPTRRIGTRVSNHLGDSIDAAVAVLREANPALNGRLTRSGFIRQALAAAVDDTAHTYPAAFRAQLVWDHSDAQLTIPIPGVDTE